MHHDKLLLRPLSLYYLPAFLVILPFGSILQKLNYIKGLNLFMRKFIIRVALSRAPHFSSWHAPLGLIHFILSFLILGILAKRFMLFIISGSKRQFLQVALHRWINFLLICTKSSSPV
jgi:hypothetical protein